MVAVEGPPGPIWVAELEARWAAGDAVLPVDHRLPPPAVEALYSALCPTVVTAAGSGVDYRRTTGREVEAGDAIVLATSGTTGAPKGVVLTHDAVQAAARATSETMGVDPSTDSWLGCLPVAHAGGLGVVTRAIVTGTPLEVLPAFDARAVRVAADAMRSAGRRVLISVVATALRRIDPSMFRVVVLGGDAPPQWPDGRPSSIVVTYGLTESGGGCVYDGRPIPGVEVGIVGGEVVVRGPVLGRAYREAHGDRPLCDPDGWLRTGDGGSIDADGRLMVAGRIGDVIVTGGEKVWPQPVERLIRTCRGVAEVAVIGRPDPEWGERVVAVIVAGDGARPTLAEVRDAVRAELPAYAAPKAIEWVDRLPTTALGKVRRTALRVSPPTSTV